MLASKQEEVWNSGDTRRNGESRGGLHGQHFVCRSLDARGTLWMNVLLEGDSHVNTVMTFDTLAYAKKLQAVGFTEAQAEVQAETLVELMEERLATKLDIEVVRRDMKEMETGLKRDMKEMETGLKRDIEVVRRDMKEMETGLKRDMKEMETGLKRDMKEMELRLTHNLTLRLGGMMAASVAVVAALVKLL